MRDPYRILSDLRAGSPLADDDLAAVARGASDGSWSDAQLGAFLMAAAIRGLDAGQTRALTLAMLRSGERWHLAEQFPKLADKHSTGGIGDKTTIVLAPLLAACDIPVVMLTGRGLGHTGGTADKLESIPGLRQELDREEATRLVRETGIALGLATAGIAPADRKLYALRDRTATVDSLPLIVASIVSKKLASGASVMVFDVKTGDGAFLPDESEARALARLLVEVAGELGTRSGALLTDMSQPLGDWVGHAAEVREALDCLEGAGPEETLRLTFALALEIGALLGVDLGEERLRAALGSGRARECFVRWAVAQGAEPGWFARPTLPLAPVERVVEAPRSGVVAGVRNRRLGMLLGEAGGARRAVGAELDRGVSVRWTARLGRRVEAGEELARLYLRRDDDRLAARFAECFVVEDEAAGPPPLIRERIRG
ncbi:MAG TPA: thymidine phosphorylase [Thermoanaerobaculia bacterium]|nr:thymidine phosphorylase [Thermoanaerobaculia bacterium]